MINRRPDSLPARDSTGLAGAVWLLYGAGALGGAIAEVNWHAAALVVPIAIVSLIAAVALTANQRAGGDTAGNGRS